MSRLRLAQGTVTPIIKAGTIPVTSTIQVITNGAIVFFSDDQSELALGPIGQPVGGWFLITEPKPFELKDYNRALYAIVIGLDADIEVTVNVARPFSAFGTQGQASVTDPNIFPDSIYSAPDGTLPEVANPGLDITTNISVGDIIAGFLALIGLATFLFSCISTASAQTTNVNASPIALHPGTNVLSSNFLAPSAGMPTTYFWNVGIPQQATAIHILIMNIAVPTITLTGIQWNQIEFRPLPLQTLPQVTALTCILSAYSGNDQIFNNSNYPQAVTLDLNHNPFFTCVVPPTNIGQFAVVVPAGTTPNFELLAIVETGRQFPDDLLAIFNPGGFITMGNAFFPCTSTGLSSAISRAPSSGAVIDARRCTSFCLTSNVTISTVAVDILFGYFSSCTSSSEFIITASGTEIHGQPSFGSILGTVFNFTGTTPQFDVGDGTNPIFNVSLTGLQVIASGSATLSGTADGYRCRNCRYSRHSQLAAQHFNAGVGYADIATSSSFSATNKLDFPFMFDNLAGIYSVGTGASNAANDLEVTGGFIICNNIVGSVGISYDVNTSSPKSLGVDVESCPIGWRNVSDHARLYGNRSEGITGTAIANQVGATNLEIFGHAYYGGGVNFTDAGTGTIRCDTDICQNPAGFTSSTFANLPASANGTVYGCSDCTSLSNPCVGGGTGTIAVRKNGAWVCL